MTKNTLLFPSLFIISIFYSASAYAAILSSVRNDINTQDLLEAVYVSHEHGEDPIFAAIRKDSPHLPDLLKTLPDLNIKMTSLGLTPLLYAIQHKRLQTAHELLTRGANPLDTDKFKCNLLHHIATEYISEKTWQKLRPYITPEIVNQQNNHDNTPLHIAVSNCRDNIPLLLSVEGCNADIQTTEGLTPLTQWVRYHHGPDDTAHIDIFKKLFYATHNPDACDNNGDTLLHLGAMGYGALSLLQTILELTQKRLLETKNKAGQTPLKVAIARGLYQHAGIILDHVDLNSEALGRLREAAEDTRNKQLEKPAATRKARLKKAQGDESNPAYDEFMKKLNEREKTLTGDNNHRLLSAMAEQAAMFEQIADELTANNGAGPADA